MLFFRGKEFRTSFDNLDAVKAYFPGLLTVALTATASEETVSALRRKLSMADDTKIVSASPNRENIYLEIKSRRANYAGDESYEEILRPG